MFAAGEKDFQLHNILYYLPCNMETGKEHYETT